MSRRTTIAAAFAVDLTWGEPPNALHPTVWMGRWIETARAARRSRAPASSLLEGSLWLIVGAAATLLTAAALDRGVRRGAGPIHAVLRGAALKPALALRSLLAAAHEVERALAAGDLAEGRRLLAWHLVSRDTRELSASEVAGATIESLAENLGDALVAPLLAFRAGGVPAAYLHRFVNTADAMLGYRTPELEWFGKSSARADDLLNLVPARLTALLLTLAAPLAGGDARSAAAVALRDAGRTASPNAGWPISAAAGALGIRLDKRGVYVLNTGGRAPEVDDIRRARHLVAGAAVLAGAICT